MDKWNLLVFTFIANKKYTKVFIISRKIFQSLVIQVWVCLCLQTKEPLHQAENGVSIMLPKNGSSFDHQI